MPYGDLRKQIVQRFSSLKDLDKYECTIEEREEYEKYIEMGLTVYAGVDYEKILRRAEKEADIILWDGGNNDLPFFKPDLHIVVVDPMRPGHEMCSYPGEANLRMADVIVVNKVGSARKENVERVIENCKKANPRAKMILADSRIHVDKPELIKNKRVIVVEDGPSVTHGGLSYGAGYIAAKIYGASKIVDPRPYAVGDLKRAYEEYRHMGPVVPSLGYGERQIRDLEETLNNAEADVIILGTPSDISRYLKLNKPVVKVFYELVEISGPSLGEIVEEFLTRI
ncbi:MAG: hypothetical protein DRN49_06740 [Thaumarchaeota archaeon]|nr:MAG: hypothetical protein DRN49_06740 [Nitrososphaerota archaeon]